MSAVMTEQGLERNILIVDDEPLQRESLRQMLELSGYQVEAADSGEAAIGMLQNYTFDLLLLDLNMPGMSGFGVIDYVVEHQIPSKILVVSGDANFETAREALGKGAYDFVKKPYAPDELLTTIGNAASKKELEDANSSMRQKLSESEYLHRFIVEHSPDIVFMLDTDGKFTFLNDTVYQTLGFNKSELIGHHYSKIVSNQSKDQAKYVFTERRSDERKSSHVELKLKCRGESEYRYFDMTSMAIMLQESNHGDGGFQGTYGVARDVTEKKNAQELINFQAYHDLLTKLPNRSLMEDRLGIAITQARRNKQSLAVMFLDLDRFKWVNDTMGHAMGDRLLQAVGQRMENTLRKGDTLARFGGDEFALILPQITRAEDAGTIAEKILNEFKDPFKLDEHELYVSGSIGIAVYPEAG
ncbi:MAG: diguanylate cyclase (GGDEF)-like protein/PAS domain S-box-containing protein, partial [Candidatus Azotimanducaceae bacterium]